jgi:hypothetical protein
VAQVVVVHGVGQQYLGPRSMHGVFARGVVDGVRLSGGPPLSEDDVEVAFYGDWFRPEGHKGEPFYQARDVNDEFERDLLFEWWRGAAREEPDVVVDPDASAQKVKTPLTAQRALDALSHSRFLTGIANRFLIGILKQVRQYLIEPETRSFVLDRVASTICDDTRILIGHSLGSVVAYEALCAHPDWPIKGLITLGSPLGIRNLVFDRLQPAPVNGLGQWPGEGRQWSNLCDRCDVVALVKKLSPLFPGVVDYNVNNGWKAHAVLAHLTAVQTGRAVAAVLAG